MILDSNNEKNRGYDEIFANTILTLVDVKNVELFYKLCLDNPLNRIPSIENK